MIVRNNNNTVGRDEGATEAVRESKAASQGIGGCAGMISLRLLGSRTNQSMPSANDQWDKGL